MSSPRFINPALMVISLLSGIVAGGNAEQESSGEVSPLPRAFAHNDYYHARPLFDALDRGFCGVEADVFRVEEELLVAHTKEEIDPERTLQELYLEPLRARVRANDGKVYASGPETFWLMIDIKSDGEEAWPLLHQVLAEYEEMLTVLEDGRLKPGPVRVVISGSRPVEMMRRASVLYAGVDGRVEDLESNDPSEFMPWVSDHWHSHFTWQGEGPMPQEERKRLIAIVEKAHEQDRMVRFWGAPEQPAVWQVLLDNDVDWINTDDLGGLRAFLLEAKAEGN